MVYLSASNSSPSPLGLVPPQPGQSDMKWVRGFAPGAGRGGLTVQGLPLLKPPYGTITAIDLKTGDIAWQVPHGETPDAIRSHDALKGLSLPRTGQPGSVGTLVTKTLVIAGDPEVTNVAPRGRAAMLRAYDKATGKEVGALAMPAPQSGSPMTYQLDGRQYIVVAVSGGPYSGEYIAYRVPVARR
jgi:quinoprotein glucose dehydrogenase